MCFIWVTKKEQCSLGMSDTKKIERGVEKDKIWNFE